MNIVRLFSILIIALLFSSCANIDMHIPDHEKSGIKSSEIIILPVSENIGLQIFGSRATGMGAIVDLAAELSLNSRLKNSDEPISELHTLLEGGRSRESIAFSISENLKGMEWLQNANISIRKDIEGFNLNNDAQETKSEVIIVISPKHQLSPWLDMIETRTKIQFFYSNNIEKPFYSTLAITQSKIIDMAWLNKGASFQSNNKPLESSIEYWKKDNAQSLQQLINVELEEASRLISICIEEAVFPNDDDRKLIRVEHENLAGQGWEFSLDGYSLSRYSTEEREIIRRIPQPMQYPAHAINAIFSLPRDQKLQNINNRH
ncbi:hypothetical protein ACJJID_02150 [Microbulbifer sp. CnH-101-G]|uniref:hypothetical protein n=1 Tax=Microbulbifer sp. CnH-101-G TaxID=3243393 RepID=UPI00403A2C00